MTTSAVLSVPAADPAVAAAHYLARLAFEADVSDVHADLMAGAAGVVVVDSRSDVAWAQGRIPGAVHIPTARIAELAPQLIAPGATVVTYCWGPGCNGATRAALAFARLGFPVKEMLGGFEYWAREGFAYDTDHGTEQRPVDDLTAPRSGISCAC
ncbi:rhodanese-like domain-containing protein [Streptomyces sp. CB01881]|uniref:rhodanese-like domain-containing protein n=1 Tax=Streptomyces sp. CB01881 TaxID=2078691 RepID=UPI000CDCD084|nr:rhodanese-like domain-containing protein [Streptomyces sp. CB01881]AUY52789.1 sulfurtransferase [Streptomyces sp. CB01881]TYC70507.1 rhodanese-like domain-containing protein [Streptomyces sp. CB01881]